jgi:hypothetical protein
MGQLPEVGILGGKSVGNFESPPPAWFEQVAAANAVGAQAPEKGYLTNKADMLWGAGMVLRRQVWQQLRQCGFAFVTGKQVTKAVGEDSELCLAARALGWKLFYAPELLLHHLMPAARITWNNMLRLSAGFGYTHPYLRYYIMAADPETPSHLLDPETYLKWMIRLKWRKVRDIVIRSRGRALVRMADKPGDMVRYSLVQQMACLKQLRRGESFVGSVAQIRQVVACARQMAKNGDGAN